MALGHKTGGRQKGTPNKRTTEVAELLSALNCDPIQGMAEIAMDPDNSAELRGRMFAELAGYLFPKRKATEIKIDDGPRVTFQFIAETVPNEAERISRSGDFQPDAGKNFPSR